jgi:PST family polysaccharide transporter
LAGFALMAITSAICLPLTQILIRDLLGSAFSWDSAGIWEGMNKLSSTYLLFVTSVLSLYYLPKLSKLTHATDIKREILSAYKLILPVVIVISVFVFFIREFVVVLLFSVDFLPMQDLFFWQLTGDVLKIGSWLVSFVMISQAMVKRYIVTELLFSASLYLFTVFLTPVFGLEGAVIAYALNYGLYWIVVTLIVFGAIKK